MTNETYMLKFKDGNYGILTVKGLMNKKLTLRYNSINYDAIVTINNFKTIDKQKIKLNYELEYADSKHPSTIKRKTAKISLILNVCSDKKITKNRYFIFAGELKAGELKKYDDKLMKTVTVYEEKTEIKI